MRSLGYRALLLLALLVVGAGAAVAATTPDEMLKDPAQEVRARALSRELRCLVCQNESIDDSNADLARDLRRIVRERIVAGDSDDGVRQYLVARYGDFVLLKPPVEPATYLLWFGPPLILALGGCLLFAFYRARGQVSIGGDRPPAELSAEERARLERVLAGEGNPP